MTGNKLTPVLMLACLFVFQTGRAQAQNMRGEIRATLEKYAAHVNIITESFDSYSNREVERQALELERMFVSDECYVYDFVDCAKNIDRADCRVKLYEFIPFLESSYKKTRVSFDYGSLRWKEISGAGDRANYVGYIIQNSDGYLDGRAIRGQEPKSSLEFYLVYDRRRGTMKIAEIVNNRTDRDDWDTYGLDDDFCPGLEGTVNGCPDNDRDGIPDENKRYPRLYDRCPDEKGVHNENDLQYHGCPNPDSDGDGVLDSDDKCPDVPGVKNTRRPECNGCPDRDGDFVCDEYDYCPNDRVVSGVDGCPDRDGDGVPDKNERYPENVDKCPTMPGKGSNYYRSSECLGCPDKDGDLTCDENDWCPNIPGSIAVNGCPDSDADGVPDRNERYPSQTDNCLDSRQTDKVDKNPNGKNASRCYGCLDSDGDGYCNSIDNCPDRYSKSNGGCPPPPPPKPQSKLDFSLSTGLAFPIGSLGSNDFYDSDFDVWSQVGFAKTSWNIDAGLGYNITYFLGIGASAGYTSARFSETALASNIKIAFIDNSIAFEDITATSEAYGFTYLTGRLVSGYFRQDSRFSIKIEPAIGFLQNSSNNIAEVLIRYENAPLERLNFDYSGKSSFSRLFKVDLAAAYEVLPQLHIGFKLGYLNSSIELTEQNSISNASLPELNLDKLDFTILHANVVFNYFIAKGSGSDMANPRFFN